MGILYWLQASPSCSTTTAYKKVTQHLSIGKFENKEQCCGFGFVRIRNFCLILIGITTGNEMENRIRLLKQKIPKNDVFFITLYILTKNYTYYLKLKK